MDTIFTTRLVHTIARSALCCAAALLAAALLPGVLAAQDEGFDPVAAGEEALRESADLPWYDAETDSVVPLPAAERKAPPPRPTEGTLIENDTDTGMRMRGSPEAMWYMVQMLGVLVLAAVLVTIIALIVSALLGRNDRNATTELERVTASQIDRVDDLPVPLKRAQSDLLGEARRQFELGDYNEAIIYLYSYLLVELDKSNCIRLVRGKTNRQYLRELRESPELTSLVGETMIAFEDVYFGQRTLSRERFEACWRQLDQFHRELELAVA